MNDRDPRPIWAIIAITGFAAVLFVGIVLMETEPHIPILLGGAIAAVCAMLGGKSWESVEEGITAGLSQAATAILILMLIGVLMGVWILSGVVPAMIFYGLGLLSPQFFLVSAMLLCAVVSIPAGSWGTAGTVGLALMGIAGAMGIPAPLAAGAIVSGAYFGDKVSPLSDSTNLASAVAGVDVFKNVRHMFPVSMLALLISGAAYTILGAGYGGNPSGMEEAAALAANLDMAFNINPVCFLPLILMAACVFAKIPSIPGIFVGILSAGVVAVFMQGVTAADVLHAAYEGYISQSGDVVMDELLTAGGLGAMMHPVSMVICAMVFGGVMETTGMMRSLTKPLVARLKSRFSLVTAAVAGAIGINILLPDQYIAIVLPGRMLAGAYDERNVPRADLARALGAGGSSFSAQIPWNTCGVFMAGVLGVSAFSYGPYAFVNWLMAPLVILLSLIPDKGKNRK